VAGVPKHLDFPLSHPHFSLTHYTKLSSLESLEFNEKCVVAICIDGGLWLTSILLHHA